MKVVIVPEKRASVFSEVAWRTRLFSIISNYRVSISTKCRVWLLTGSGNGLGRDIAEAALATGNSVVAGARRTEELTPLVAQYGERVKPVRLEVRDEAAARAAVELQWIRSAGSTFWSTMPVMGSLRRSSR